jgi:2-keto-4-pentenoate hydratase
MIGYLTTDRQIPSGGTCKASDGSTLLTEAEIALQMGADITIDMTPQQALASVSAVAPALEIVDTSRVTSGEIGDILAGNLFHEAVVIGNPLSLCSVPGKQEIHAELSINKKIQRTLEQDRVPNEFGTLIKVVAGILAKQGETLQAGDWVITGAATTPVPVSPGDEISLSMAPLGELSLSISKQSTNTRL